MTEPIPVAVLGATGYTGAELLRYLFSHPGVRVRAVAARSSRGKALVDALPSLRGVAPSMTIEEPDCAALAAKAEAFFCCLPHGASQQVVHELRTAGHTVFDLSADHRFSDADSYAAAYGPHDHPERLRESQYGLPELFRDQLAGAKLVGVPGCYPTATTLAIWPALANELICPDSIIADAKSGISGAGKAAGDASHFPECGESFTAYQVLQHRHRPEIEHVLAKATGAEPRVLFTPHLVPMSRGILCTVYGELKDGVSAAQLRGAYDAAYASEPFVHLLPEAVVPRTGLVRGSNQAHINVFVSEADRRLIAFCAIDNLGKGAAGQAVQCFNLVHGLDETTGLQGAPLFP